MSTMWGSTPRWMEEVAYYETESFGTLADLRELLRLSRGRHGLILFGAVSLRQHRYRDLVFALLVKMRRGPRPRVLITDATWQTESKSLARVTGLPPAFFGLFIKIFVRLIDGRHVRYAVLSTDELSTFPQVWGVDPDRVLFTPFPATMEPDTPAELGDYLFAGGNSLRDYDLLADAVRGTGVPVRVAARWAPAAPIPDLVAGSVSHDEFVRLLAGCRAAVVPLERTIRSAGQQSYLNAMMLRKPVIVTDAPGVRDYIQDGVTGVVVPPDPEALRAAILDVMDPAQADKYAEMGERARAWVLENATDAHYKDHVLLDAIGLPA